MQPDVTELTHLLDDALVTRSALYRAATESLAMLSLALSANAKGKPHVVQDHLERVVDYLANARDLVDSHKENS
jgi:hypothetical protein